MNYSIIIPFYDNKNLLDMSLQNLFQYLPKNKYEIIIVNDNPNLTIDPKYSSKMNMKIINNSENRGYGGACNIGAEEAKAEYLIFIDSDMVPSDGCFEALFKTKEKIGKFGSIGSKIIDLSTGRLLHFGLAFHEIDVLNPFQFNSPDFPFTMKDKTFQAHPSGIMLFRRELFLSMGGFDPRLYNAYTDIDLCCRLNQERFKTWVSSNSIFFHRGMVSGSIRYAFHSDAKTLFFKRWGDKLTNDGLNIFEYACLLFKKNSNFKRESKYCAINLSNSLYFHNYLEEIERYLKIKIVQKYNLPTLNRKIPHMRLEDRLTWDLCRLNLPIIYFADNFMTLRSNYFWFSNRVNKGDIIADKNGNIFLTRDISLLS